MGHIQIYTMQSVHGLKRLYSKTLLGIFPDELLYLIRYYIQGNIRIYVYRLRDEDQYSMSIQLLIQECCVELKMISFHKFQLELAIKSGDIFFQCESRKRDKDHCLQGRQLGGEMTLENTSTQILLSREWKVKFLDCLSELSNMMNKSDCVEYHIAG